MRAQDLGFRHGNGHLAVDGVDLDIAPGTVYGLLGANGAGKTTTIQLLLGLLRPTAGVAEVAGVDVTIDPAGARRACAYVPERVALYETFSGIENLRYFASLSGHPLSPVTAIDLLADAGLSGAAAHRWTGEYSKGMRQKVGLAIAMACEARVLLLDEPLSGLDPVAAGEFCNALVALASERRLAVLMATHDLLRARFTCTRVGIMRAGRIVEERDTAAIATDDLDDLYRRTVLEADG